MKQYNDVPKVFNIPTYIFTRLPLDVETIIKMDFDRKAIKDFKAYVTKDDALFGSVAWVFDRIKYDKELMDNNEKLTIQHYIGGLSNDDLLINSVKLMVQNYP